MTTIFFVDRRVHITQQTLDHLDTMFSVTPHLTSPVNTYLINKTDSSYNPDLLTVPQHHHKPKYGEGWSADMPFAKISEKRLAKTISIAVT